MATTCSHFDPTSSVAPRTAGCEECLLMGRDWLHLRLCLTCGHVGCCDDSDGKHATAHFQSTGHEVVKSLEEGENWYWCFMDNDLIQFENEGSESTIYSVSNQEMTTNSVLLPFNSTDGNTARSSLPIKGTSSVSNRSRGMFKSICQRVRRCNKQKLEPTIELAVEIAREGREGRRIGTLFTFGDAEGVLARSRALILDPLAGHSDMERQITNANLRGTIKELAQLDGAFVVSDEGIVLAACRYLDATASDVVLPYGMASRHLAGASISQVTDAVAIVVSESSMVRVFDDGKLVAEIIPELWLMDHYNVQLPTPYEEVRAGDLAVLTAKS